MDQTMKKVAIVPYAPGRAYEFYDDRVIIDDTIIHYSEIKGYSYLLSHKKTSIDFIPAGNSTSFTVYFDVGQKKPFHFGRSHSSVMYFKTDEQRTLDVIFTELVRCIEALIAPDVFKKLVLPIVAENMPLTIGSLTINQAGLTKKTTFGQKSIYASEIGWAGVHQGFAIVKDSRNKNFFSCSLSTMNAPLIPDILNALYSAEQ